MERRKRIAINLPADLVAALDRGVRRGRFASRSAAIEDALRMAERAERDAAITEYYLGRSDEERREERAWGEAGAEALGRSFRRRGR
jgi:Arc/MetJ-type ribon-helix-helix transcriptional regulator